MDTDTLPDDEVLRVAAEAAIRWRDLLELLGREEGE
jgi:hypothetical protein